MCESIFHFEGNPTQFSTRKGVEGCCDVLTFLSDESSRLCFNLFGFDPKSMKRSFFSVMDLIEQEVNYIGRLIDSVRFTPECLAERTKNLLTLQQLCEGLVIEVLNSSLRSFSLDGGEFKMDDITMLFHESNTTLRVALFGSEMNSKTSDIKGVLYAIDSARNVPGVNADNLNVLATVYTQARNQLVAAGIESYTPSLSHDTGNQDSTGKSALITSGKRDEAWHGIVSAFPAILKGAADIMFGMLF